MRKKVNEGYHLYDTNDELMDAQTAADFIGIKRDTLYKRIKMGHMKAHHVGTRVYFLRSEIICEIRDKM